MVGSNAIMTKVPSSAFYSSNSLRYYLGCRNTTRHSINNALVHPSRDLDRSFCYKFDQVSLVSLDNYCGHRYGQS